MDDKNNNDQIIDFSNQPLGMMAQEGAKIEEQLNKEYQENEEKRQESNSNVQNNPFDNVTPVSEPSNEIVNTGNEIIGYNTQTGEPIYGNSSTPPTQPSQVVEQQPNLEEVKKEEILNELVNQGNSNEQKNDEQPASWGIFVFLIFIAIIGVSVFLFKSGKLDSLLGNKEEESVYTAPVNSNKQQDIVEEPQQEITTQIEPAEVKNYRIKQTIYIAMDSTFNNTTIGTVDVEANKGKFITTVAYNGITSHNMDEYCDYNVNYCYLQDFNNKNKWSKEKLDSPIVKVEERLKYVQSFGTATEVSPGNFKISLTKTSTSLVLAPLGTTLLPPLVSISGLIIIILCPCFL